MDFVTNSTCSWTNRHDLMIYLLSCLMLFSVFSVFTGEIVFAVCFAAEGLRIAGLCPEKTQDITASTKMQRTITEQNQDLRY